MGYHRVVRTIHRGLPLTIFWVYVGAFLIAFVSMFIHPVATILLLWLGLTSLGFAVAITHILGAMRRTSARRILRRGSCPACGAQEIAADGSLTEPDQAEEQSEPDLCCGACGAAFEAGTGHEVETE